MLVIGGCGNIGSKLKRKWPCSITVDRKKNADFVFDLNELGKEDSGFYDLLTTSDVVVHLATSADPDGSELAHFQSLENTAKLVNACAHADVPNLILASSDWAAPSCQDINTYGQCKRAIEAMADMYAQNGRRVCTAIRIGWVPHDDFDIRAAPEWLLKNHWDTCKLIQEFKVAISKKPNKNRHCDQ